MPNKQQTKRPEVLKNHATRSSYNSVQFDEDEQFIRPRANTFSPTMARKRRSSLLDPEKSRSSSTDAIHLPSGSPAFQQVTNF